MIDILDTINPAEALHLAVCANCEILIDGDAKVAYVTYADDFVEAFALEGY